VTPMLVTPADWVAIFPALVVLVTGLLVVGVDLFPLPNRLPLVAVSLAGVGVAAWQLVLRLTGRAPDILAFAGSLVADGLSAYLSLGILAATVLLLVAADTDTRRRRIAFGEYYGLVLIAAAAMMLLVASNDLLMIFINLEILSLSLYVLTGITRRSPRSNEASMKYLVTGGFATGFLLMGVALIYGATGTIRLEEIGLLLRTGTDSSLLTAGFGLLLVGFAFKIGAVPFHMWVPDVYEGAPTTTTAFMAVTVKAAGVGALVRVVLIAAASRPDLWADVLWFMAFATMIVGNLLAIQQDSVKRMLAYSSVAHTGYALVAVATMSGTDGLFSSAGATAALFYLFVYTFMTFGAFALLVYMGHEVPVPGKSEPEWQDAEHIDDLAGIATRRPWAALAMAIFLVSLGGIPPTAGFVGKFMLFSAAVDQGHVGLVIVGVLASLVSMYYYLRVVVAMYMRESVSTDEVPSKSMGLVVALAVAGTIYFGVQPSLFLYWAERSIKLLMS